MAFTELEGSIPGPGINFWIYPGIAAPASVSFWPYLVLSIITPAPLFHLGAIIVPVGLAVGSIVVPALLSLSCLCVIPAGLGVSLGVALVIIPASLRLLRLLVIVRLWLLCGRTFLLQEVRAVAHCGRFGSKRRCRRGGRCAGGSWVYRGWKKTVTTGIGRDFIKPKEGGIRRDHGINNP